MQENNHHTTAIDEFYPVNIQFYLVLLVTYQYPISWEGKTQDSNEKLSWITILTKFAWLIIKEMTTVVRVIADIYKIVVVYSVENNFWINQSTAW